MVREKPPSVGHSPTTTTTTTIISKDLSSEVVSQITGFMNRIGISERIPHNYTTKGSHSDFIRGLFVKVDLVQRRRISCLLSVKPAVTSEEGKKMVMEKTSPTTTITTTTTTSDKVGMMAMTSETLSNVAAILQPFDDTIPLQFDSKGFHSDFIRGLLKTHRVDRGRISSLLSVKHPVLNVYGTLHGGAVASVAEIMSIACARTVVGEDKELFLGELSTTYLSAAPHNISGGFSPHCGSSAFGFWAELTVDASVIRSGKSLTLIVVEFKAKDTGKLVFTSHATFYHMPVASL